MWSEWWVVKCDFCIRNFLAYLSLIFSPTLHHIFGECAAENRRWFFSSPIHSFASSPQIRILARTSRSVWFSVLHARSLQEMLFNSTSWKVLHWYDCPYTSIMSSSFALVPGYWNRWLCLWSHRFARIRSLRLIACLISLTWVSVIVFTKAIENKCVWRGALSTATRHRRVS